MRGGRRPRSATAGGEAVAHPLDVTDDDVGRRRSRRPSTADLGDDRGAWSPTPAPSRPASIHEVDTERFAREIDVNLLGAHRLVRAFVPGMVERRRGDVVFVSSDVAVRPRPFMAAYAAGKWGLEGMAHAHADGARGHRRPRVASSAPARPGARWAATGTTEDAADVLNQWVRFGLARHPHFLKPAAHRRRDRHGRLRAARRAPEPGRGDPGGPLEDR